MTPQLSIIVPVYNVEQFLPKCLDSILAQSFNDFELLIIDDGSADGSGSICDEYARRDHRIQVYHQDNQGLAQVRNKGISLASGEYIGFVDSDDWIEKDMFQNLVNAACINQADVAICRVRKISPEGVIEEDKGYEKPLVMSNLEATQELFRDINLKSYPWNKIYKKTLFADIQYPTNRLFEDLSTTFKLVYKSNRVVAIPYFGYNYLTNLNGIVNSNNLSVEKKIKRELDYALAFGERYLLRKSVSALSSVLPICTQIAYERMRGLLHLRVHRDICIPKDHEALLNQIMCTFDYADLSMFSFFNKLDLLLYKYCKPLLNVYLKSVALLHPLNRDL